MTKEDPKFTGRDEQHTNALQRAVQTAVDRVRTAPESLETMRQLLEMPTCDFLCPSLTGWLKDALFDSGHANENTLPSEAWSDHDVVQAAAMALALNRAQIRPEQAALTHALVELTCGEALTRLRLKILAGE